MLITIEMLDAVNSKVVDKKHYEILWRILSYEVESYLNHTTYYKSLFRRKGGRFPTGLLPIVKIALEREGHTIRLRVPDIIRLSACGSFPYLTAELEDYQKKVIEKVMKHRRGIIIAPTGSGKTILEAAIIDTYDTPKTLIIVPTRDLLYQTIDELRKLLDIDETEEIGILGDSRDEVRHITVGLYQTLVRYDLKGVDDFFDMVLIDEVHASRSDSYQIILNQLKSIHYRYGFTGTMRVKQPDRYIIQGIIGKPIAIVSDEQAEKRVTDVKLYMIKYSDTLAYHRDYTERVRYNIWINENRNNFIADIVRFIVADLNKNVLVLAEKIEQVFAMSQAIGKKGVVAPVIYSKTSNEEREKLKNLFNSRNLPCLIATSAISVGTNIPNIEFLIIASEVKDSINLTQKIGRGRRRTSNKDVLYAIDIFNNFSGNDTNFKKQSIKKRNVYSKKGWLENIVTFEEFKELVR